MMVLQFLAGIACVILALLVGYAILARAVLTCGDVTDADGGNCGAMADAPAPLAAQCDADTDYDWLDTAPARLTGRV